MNRVQASAVEGEPLPKPDRDDVPLAKRRKAMLAEKSSPSAKVSLPVSRQPARRDKAAGPSGSNGKDATSQNSDVPNKNKVKIDFSESQVVETVRFVILTLQFPLPSSYANLQNFPLMLHTHLFISFIPFCK